tara:strand:- start:438 stop:632 length:195 start_codon:yes stop_codon:yes gene_type:complete
MSHVSILKQILVLAHIQATVETLDACEATNQVQMFVIAAPRFVKIVKFVKREDSSKETQVISLH